MLTLLLGRDWIANRDAVLELVAADVHSGKGNRILMVPELISHDMERRLCTAAGDTASRYAEVLSFTRLARRVADNVGFAARECLDNGGRVVAMAAATRQLHSKLKAYASVETRPEFLSGLVDAIDEFKRCCVNASDLKEASRQTEGSFSQKLDELSLILEAYDGICSRGKRDPRDQMTWLLEQLWEGDFAQTHTFYFDGFPDYSRQHFMILEYLVQASPNVTVSLTCDRRGSEMLAFEKAAETAADLIQCAKKLGIEYHIRYIEEKESDIPTLKEHLFQGAVTYNPNLVGKLSLTCCDSVYEECSVAAERIMELVRGGCRFREIGVVCTDMVTYQHAIKLVFNRCGIPVYQSGTEGILEKSVISTVLSALDAALGGFDSQDVLRYLKSVLSPLPAESVDLMENYGILWGINGNRWLSQWENHPDGLGEEWSDSVNARLQRLNTDRETALRPLARLRDRFRSARIMQEQIHALCDFFEEIRLAERLGQLADQLDRAGDNRSAQILNQLWEILLSALEQMYDVLGETAWDSVTFTKLFTLLLSQYDVGTIPPVLDSVTVGPVSAMRCHQVEHMIVLGAQEGALPHYGGGSGILTEQERNALREMGVPLNGSSMEGLQTEFSEIYGVFCAARRSVHLTYSSGQPSFVYRRLLTLAGKESTPTRDVTALSEMDIAALLVRTGDTAAAQSLDILDAHNAVFQHSSYALGKVTRENIAGLYGSKLRLSASQVDRQAECRFLYFMRHGMRAKERLEAQVDPAEFGTYVHAVLEETAKDVMALGGFHKVSLEKTMEIAMGHSENYAQQRFRELDSQRMVYLFRRNIQELEMVVRELWQELSISEFAPVGFEVAFGDEQQMPAIEIPDAQIEAQLRGFVDRVDHWSNGYADYFRVVDYKTGRKDFDYCDVFNGLGLQMLLYLFALEQGGHDLLGENPVPVGVQYFPARSPLLTASGRLTQEEAEAERSKTWKRKGLLLADSEVLEAMEPEGSSKRLSCKVTKDGTLTGDVADRDQLKLLKRYIFHTLKGMVNEIASGEISPNPYTRGSAHNACSYCPYQDVCHYTTVEGRRNYKAMSAQRFWDEIGKEMNHHG